MGLTLPAKRARCIVKTSFAALCIIIIGGFFMLSFVLPGCDGRDIRNTLSALRGSIAQVKSYILYGSSKLMLNIQLIRALHFAGQSRISYAGTRVSVWAHRASNQKYSWCLAGMVVHIIMVWTRMRAGIVSVRYTYSLAGMC